MQHLMRKMAARLAEELGVHRFDRFTLMRFAYGELAVRIIKRCGAAVFQINEVTHYRVLNRLSAAVDAAAGATHDLDEMIGGCAGLHLLHERVGIGGAAGDRHLELEAGHFIFRFLHAVHAAHVGEIHVVERLAGERFNGRAESSFHYAARRAKDDGRAGALAERIVEFLIRQVLKVDASALNHAGKLAGGERDIHIRHLFLWMHWSK